MESFCLFIVSHSDQISAQKHGEVVFHISVPSSREQHRPAGAKTSTTVLSHPAVCHVGDVLWCGVVLKCLYSFRMCNVHMKPLDGKVCQAHTDLCRTDFMWYFSMFWHNHEWEQRRGLLYGCSRVCPIFLFYLELPQQLISRLWDQLFSFINMNEDIRFASLFRQDVLSRTEGQICRGWDLTAVSVCLQCVL